MKLLIVMAIMLFVGCGNPIDDSAYNSHELAGEWESLDMVLTFTEKEFEWLVSGNEFKFGTWIPKKDSVTMNWNNKPSCTYYYRMYNDILLFLNRKWVQCEQQY